jgi:hypothetical protein
VYDIVCTYLPVCVASSSSVCAATVATTAATTTTAASTATATAVTTILSASAAAASTHKPFLLPGHDVADSSSSTSPQSASGGVLSTVWKLSSLEPTNPLQYKSDVETASLYIPHTAACATAAATTAATTTTAASTATATAVTTILSASAAAASTHKPFLLPGHDVADSSSSTSPQSASGGVLSTVWKLSSLEPTNPLQYKSDVETASLYIPHTAACATAAATTAATTRSTTVLSCQQEERGEERVTSSQTSSDRSSGLHVTGAWHWSSTVRSGHNSEGSLCSLF